MKASFTMSEVICPLDIMVESSSLVLPSSFSIWSKGLNPAPTICFQSCVCNTPSPDICENAIAREFILSLLPIAMSPNASVIWKEVSVSTP